ncbi:NADase-type glycan-binding domain-containing protein [Nocardioides sp.]|uniref:NADase-type glycan-binding domain-containing protein n=1 Tax=Nocardioides sp. TaxID=35761 RepID=UPI0039E51B1B
MRYCTQCGHKVEGRRTCSDCGALVPVEPLPAPPLSSAGARYPLFVGDPPEDTASRAPVAVAPRPTSPVATRHPARRRRRGVLVLALGSALAVVVAGLGLWLVLRPDDTPASSALPDVPPPAGSATWHDLAGEAVATAPATDNPGVDTDGQPTSYDASNMLDGDAGTAWRMAGDGTGQELTFTFSREVTLTEVGLINGYAKTGGEGEDELDWYLGNRRVLAVDWVFDDGTTIHQDLRETRDPQTRPVPDLATRTVTLRLTAVSAPGDGPAGRDKTSISEVSLAGR